VLKILIFFVADPDKGTGAFFYCASGMEKVIYGSGPDPQHCRLLKHMGREVLKIFKFGKLVLTEDKYRSGQENQKKTKKREEAE
jgi:hypothetical protein